MSRIAFVEFEEADSANRALDISGALLGGYGFRVPAVLMHRHIEASFDSACISSELMLPVGMLPLRISPSKTPVRNSPSDIQSEGNGSEQRHRKSRYVPPASRSGTLTDEPGTSSND